MSTLSIGQVADQSGVPASTIRYYEQIGLLPEPQRAGGQRRYTPVILKHLALVRFARNGGLGLEAIRRLLQGFPEETAAQQRWASVTPHRLQEIDQQIDELRAMRELLDRTLHCTCDSLLDCSEEIEHASQQ